MKNLMSGKVSILVLTAALAVASILAGKSFLTSARASSIDNITLCHRSDDASDPYNTQTVDTDSTDANGHGDHTGDIATSQAVAQSIKDAHKKWGDIIPPYHYDFTQGHTRHVGDFPGLNWTSDGQAIWNNSCNMVVSTPSPSNSPTATPTASPTATPTVAPTATPTATATPTTTPEPIYGCTDPEASNYNPDATRDDESCEYNGETPVPTATPAETASPEPTATPGDVCWNLDGFQGSIPDGYHKDTPDGACNKFQYGGAPQGGNGGGTQQVLGASTVAGGKVLGASTMAGTGTFEENMYLLITALGAIFTVGGIFSLKKAN